VRATPLFDESRRVRHVVNVFADITADRWKTTLQNVAQLAIPTMADWCAIEVVESDGSIALSVVALVDSTIAGRMTSPCWSSSVAPDAVQEARRWR
jgi:hypothetical protein